MNEIRYTGQGDAKRQIWYGSNYITRTIDVGTRVMLTRKTVFRVTHVNDFEYNGEHTGSDGLIKALVLQTTLVDKDNLKDNVAWNENINSNKTKTGIQGKDTLIIGAKSKYSVNSTNVVWNFDEKYSFAKLEVVDRLTCTIEVDKDLSNIGKEIILYANAINGAYLGKKIIKITGFM